MWEVIDIEMAWEVASPRRVLRRVGGGVGLVLSAERPDVDAARFCMCGEGGDYAAGGGVVEKLAGRGRCELALDEGLRVCDARVGVNEGDLAGEVFAGEEGGLERTDGDLERRWRRVVTVRHVAGGALRSARWWWGSTRSGRTDRVRRAASRAVWPMHDETRVRVLARLSDRTRLARWDFSKATRLQR